MRRVVVIAPRQGPGTFSQQDCTRRYHGDGEGYRIYRATRAGQAPEAAAHGCDDTRSFLGEFYPGSAAMPPLN
jgi:hypothetical protein